MSAQAVTEKLSQIAHNMATHAVSNLNSMDNVTVLIILLRGGPVSCPIDLSVPPAVVVLQQRKQVEAQLVAEAAAGAPRLSSLRARSRRTVSLSVALALQQVPMPRQQ